MHLPSWLKVSLLATAQQGGMKMTVFYRGPCAQITHEVFEVRTPVCQSFPIRDLTAVHIVEVKPKRRIGTTLVKAVAIGLAAVIAAVAATRGQFFGASLSAMAALVVVLLSTAAAAGCWRSGEPYELRAVYRGRLVCLLRTGDRLVLGQVSRALLRALERTLDTNR